MRTLRASAGYDAIGLDVEASPHTDVVASVADRTAIRQVLRDADGVLHAATLHKPHVETQSLQAFVDTNVTGTLVLLEEAAAARVTRLVYTSTTSIYGHALTPAPAQPAAWITEEVTPQPRNIYGVTKQCAEQLCELASRDLRLPCVVLRTSRFFPEEDDRAEIRASYDDDNLKVNELLYRRVDIDDVVTAHLLALEHAPRLGFARYVVTSTTPFRREHIDELRSDAPAVVARLFPDYIDIYAARGWRMFPGIERVYVNDRARAELGWAPSYDFSRALGALRSGHDWRSPLAVTVGVKGYRGTDRP